MLLQGRDVCALIAAAAQSWEEQISTFGEIDSRFGDGDHGIAVSKMVSVMRNAVENCEDPDPKALFQSIGIAIMAAGGGSAGPLYGSFIKGLGTPLEPGAVIDAEILKSMLVSSRAALQAITPAKVGEKTMVDAIYPAVDAAVACQGEIPEILKAASEAAIQGAKATEDMVSRFGRAKSYGDKTLGTPDAGAMSASVFFQGLANGAAQLAGTQE